MAEAMKDSKVTWLGEIPESWSIDRTKFHYTNLKQIAGVKSEEYERLALTLNGVIKRPKDDADGLQPGDFNGYQVLKSGDLVFKLIDLQNVSTSRVGLAHDTGIVSPAYIRLEPRRNESSRYGEYYFLSMWQREIFNQLGDAGVRSNLSSVDLLELPYIRLPYNEQVKIADFLDEKCAEINQLSEGIQKQIDILEEYKKSVITRAVAKGLNPKTVYNESSCKYIGKIPTNATMTRMKYVTKLITDGTHQTPNYQDDGKPFLSIKDISSGLIDFSDAKYISEQEHKQIYSHAPVKKGDILFTRIGTLGVSVVVDTDKEFSIFVSLGLIKPDTAKIIPAYLSYVMSSNYYYDYIQEVKAGGGTHAAKFNLGDVAESPIILYPIDEQSRIVDFLDRKCGEINESIQIKKAQLKRLDAYKKSIIYEYVTGKKRVKGAL